MEDMHTELILRRMTLVCIAITAGISSAALIGWAMNWLLLARISPAYIPMAPSSALSFVILSFALFVYARKPDHSQAMIFAKVGVFLVLLICFIILIDFFTGAAFDIEKLLYFQPEKFDAVPIGRMSPITAANFLLAGSALLFLLISPVGRHRAKSIAVCLATFVFSVGLVVVLGYLYGAPLLYGGMIIPVALTTAVAFVFMGLGLIAAVGQDYWPTRAFTGSSVRARLMRTFLPVTIALILISDQLDILIFPQIKNHVLAESLTAVISTIIISIVIPKIAQVIGGDIDRANTERKRAEEELRKVNRAYKTLSQCNQTLIRTTKESELINEICKRIVETGGYPLTWIGSAEGDEEKTIRLVAQAGYEEGYLETLNLTWADNERGRGHIGTAIRTGKSSVVKNIHTDPNYAPWRAEAIKRGYASAIALPLVANGKPFGVLNICAKEQDAFDSEEIKLLTELAGDIAYGILSLRMRAERKRSEEKLHEASLYTRNLIEASLDPLVTISPEGKITDVNEATELVTGVSRENLIGSDFSDYFTEPEKAREGYRQVFEKGFVRDYPLAIRGASGKVTDVLYNAAVYRNELGEVQGVFAAARDITELKRVEEERIKAEERVRLTLDNMLEGCMIIGFDWTYLYVNDVAARHGHQNRENLIGRTMLEIYPGVEKSSVFAAYRRCMEERVHQRFESEFTFADGTINWYELSVEPVPEGIFVLSLDITERKRAEEMRSKLASIVEFSDDAILSKTLDGIIVTWNPGAEKIYGYSADEALGKPVSILIPPGYFDEVPKILERIKHGETITHYEAKRVKKDGKQIDVSLTISPIKDDAGKIIGASTIARDITEHKRIEKNLREASLYTRSLIEVSLDPLVTISKEGKITDVNKATELVTGVSRENLIETDFSDYFTEPEKAREGYQQVFEKGFVKDYPLTIRHVSGSITDVLYNASLYTDAEGNVAGVFAAARDITEHKKAEEIRLENERLAYANQAKSDFLASMSHDLRTPLNAIIGFSELLKQKMPGELNEKQEHFVDNVLSSSKHLLALIGDILDISKIEAGKIELAIEEISVPSVTDDVLVLIKEKAARHKVILNKEFDPRLDAIEADKTKFKQILFNLLDNAVKFSKEEGGTVTITTKKTDDMAEISVSDTGIGIQEEDMGKLFTKFQQLEIGRKTGGTGLGLAISKQLVELHGGKIRVESRYGEGSTFTFSLPLKSKK